jgi:predicted cupin superfamily sugar epimerase
MIDLRDPGLSPAQVISALGLRPHPEGGHFCETWRDSPADGTRGCGTAILFLLGAGETSHWHRVDADEVWLWQAGAPLKLTLSPDGHDAAAHLLGPDLGAGQRLQHRAPPGCWQSAISLGAWSLVSCVVAPAFRFEGFELAPPEWQPATLRRPTP